MQPRTFGIEIEAHGFTPERAAEILRGVGVNTGSGGWHVKYDGSVSNGFEAASPILSGVEGLDQVSLVMNTLRAAGATVSDQCGLHVHIGAQDLSAKELANVALRYAKHEDAIDAIIQNSRRDENNTYCHSNKLYLSRNNHISSTLSSPNDTRSVAMCFGTRYMKCNMEAFLSHGTIEFRQHGGSLNPQKARAWIRFCVNFVETSRDGQLPADDISPFSGLPKTTLDYFNSRLEEFETVNVRRAERERRRAEQRAIRADMRANPTTPENLERYAGLLVSSRETCATARNVLANNITADMTATRRALRTMFFAQPRRGMRNAAQAIMSMFEQGSRVNLTQFDEKIQALLTLLETASNPPVETTETVVETETEENEGE